MGEPPDKTQVRCTQCQRIFTVPWTNRHNTVCPCPMKPQILYAYDDPIRNYSAFASPARCEPIPPHEQRHYRYDPWRQLHQIGDGNGEVIHEVSAKQLQELYAYTTEVMARFGASVVRVHEEFKAFGHLFAPKALHRVEARNFRSKGARRQHFEAEKAAREPTPATPTLLALRDGPRGQGMTIMHMDQQVRALMPRDRASRDS